MRMLPPSCAHGRGFCCVTEDVNTLILCLGNERVCDDGIAAVVGRAMQALPLPAHVTVKVGSKISFDLLDDIATTDQLVLVDALNSGGEPGMCTVVDVSELPALVASSECAHGTSVSHILDFVRYLACDGAACGVAIAGIEGRQFLSCGTGFSEEVWAAVPKLVDLVLLFVGAKVEARTMATEICRDLRIGRSRGKRPGGAEERRAQG